MANVTLVTIAEPRSCVADPSWLPGRVRMPPGQQRTSQTDVTMEEEVGPDYVGMSDAGIVFAHDRVDDHGRSCQSHRFIVQDSRRFCSVPHALQ